MAEVQRAKGQNSTVSLLIFQLDRGHELLRQLGETQLEAFHQQLARTLIGVIRQTDIAVKYNSWTVALILPSTGLAGAQKLEEKLRKAAAGIQSEWERAAKVTLSASIAEAAIRPGYDVEDIVTELINRAEAGLEEAGNRGGAAVVALEVVQA